MGRATLRDTGITIEELIAAQDKVVKRYTARGTHQGEFMIAGRPAAVAFAGIAIERGPLARSLARVPELPAS